MNQKVLGSLFSVVAIATLTSGCGSSSATAIEGQKTGTVIDDYISGANVCVDVNSNGQRDTSDTPCVRTNSLGQFNFGTATVPTNRPLVMSGGIDVGTGKAFTGTLSAPVGSSIINPLTTIVQAVVATGKSVEAAQTLVKAKLGLPASVDITTFDPLATLSTGTPEEKENAKKVFAQQSSIQVVLTSVSKTIAAAVDGTNESNVTAEAANQIAALILAPTAPATVDVAASTEILINNTANVEITDTTAKENIVAIAATVAIQVEAAADKAVATISSIDTATDTSALSNIREAAVQVHTVVDTNTDSIASALSATTVDTTAINNTVEAATATLDADVATVTVVTDLTTVANPEDNTAPTTLLTGATAGKLNF